MALVRKGHKTGSRYTQTELAKAIGVERNTVNGWMRRGSLPRDPAILSRLARELDVNIPWLTEGTGPGFPGSVRRDEAAVDALRDAPKPPLSGGARVWIQEELLDYARAGATQQEVDFAKALLESVPLWAFYSNGVDDYETEAGVLRGLRSIGSLIRYELRLRGRPVQTRPLVDYTAAMSAILSLDEFAGPANAGPAGTKSGAPSVLGSAAQRAAAAKRERAEERAAEPPRRRRPKGA